MSDFVLNLYNRNIMRTLLVPSIFATFLLSDTSSAHPPFGPRSFYGRYRVDYSRRCTIDLKGAAFINLGRATDWSLKSSALFVGGAQVANDYRLEAIALSSETAEAKKQLLFVMPTQTGRSEFLDPDGKNVAVRWQMTLLDDKLLTYWDRSDSAERPTLDVVLNKEGEPGKFVFTVRHYSENNLSNLVYGECHLVRE
jgi:hypothetical protein